MQLSITAKAQSVLMAIAGGAASREEIATKLGVSVPVVNGSITSLKRNKLVEISDKTGLLAVTAEAKPFTTGEAAKAAPAADEAKTATKMDQARKLFAQYSKQGRQVVLAHFQEQIGLTPKGASTYYQILRHETPAAPAATGNNTKH